MKEFLCLNDIKPGNRARVKELTSTGSIRRRLLDIGLVENTEVECLGQSPLGLPDSRCCHRHTLRGLPRDTGSALHWFQRAGGNGGLHQPVNYLPKNSCRKKHHLTQVRYGIA